MTQLPNSWQEQERRNLYLYVSEIHQPRRNLQIKFTRPVAEKNDFVAYIDAIGRLERQGNFRLKETAVC